MTEPPPHPGIVAPPPLLMAAAVAAGLLLHYLAPIGWLAGMPLVARGIVGGAMLLAAIVVNLQGFLGFQRAGTPVHPWKTTTTLVTTGVYDRVRNPMYLGMILLVTALGFLLASAWLLIFAALFLLILHFGVVRLEERFLELRFGDEYKRYKARVPPYGWRF